MENKEISEQVRFILATGKRIRDHMGRVQTEVITDNPELTYLSEMTMQQTSMAMITLDRGKLSVTEMANLLSVSIASASAMIERLVEKGILSRTHSKEDRRKVFITISSDAKPLLSVIQIRMQEALMKIVSKIGIETTYKWHEVMLQIRNVLDEEERIARHEK